VLSRARVLVHRLPIRARIAIFGAGVVLLTVMIFGTFVDLVFERSLRDQQDTTLRRKSEAVMRRSGLAPGAPRKVDPTRFAPPTDLRSSNDAFTLFLDSEGAVIITNAEIDGRPPRIPQALLAGARAHGEDLATMRDSGVDLRVDVRRVPTGALVVGNNPREPAFVVAGQTTGPIDAQVERLQLYTVLGALLSMLGALALSWLTAGRAMRPLDTMTTTVEAVGSAQDLRRRLPAAPANDEVGRLTRAFNAMMGRLEEAYSRLQEALEAQRRFAADASHELRTPLTSIRSNVGLLLHRDDISAVDRTEALHDMAAEAERMSRLVDALLTLARADAGQRLEMATVDLEKVCEETCRVARRTYPGRRIELSRRPVPSLTANGDSLRQLLWILLDNAARHTLDGGRITVSVDRDLESVRLAVGDDGAGIRAADQERIFERFYRGDPARSPAGAGLGLPIARWIVEQHGGRIQASSNPHGGGTIITVELPLGAGEEGTGAGSQVA
jgi:signal transduction histidine kinase